MDRAIAKALSEAPRGLSRREALARFGTGFGMLGLASLLADQAAADGPTAASGAAPAGAAPLARGPLIFRPRPSG